VRTRKGLNDMSSCVVMHFLNAQLVMIISVLCQTAETYRSRCLSMSTEQVSSTLLSQLVRPNPHCSETSEICLCSCSCCSWSDLTHSQRQVTRLYRLGCTTSSHPENPKFKVPVAPYHAVLDKLCSSTGPVSFA
jgi:hypothetical protein